MEQPIIALQNGVVRDESRRFRTPVNFTLEAGEHIAVMGLNGSGKTILIETLLGNLYLAEGKLNYDFRSDDNRASQHIRYITFRDAYGSADGEYYYQQRWNATDRESAPLASEMFDRVTCDPLERERIFDLLDIRGMLQNRSSCCRAANCGNSRSPKCCWPRRAYWSSKARSSDWTSKRAGRSKSCSSR